MERSNFSITKKANERVGEKYHRIPVFIGTSRLLLYASFAHLGLLLS